VCTVPLRATECSLTSDLCPLSPPCCSCLSATRYSSSHRPRPQNHHTSSSPSLVTSDVFSSSSSSCFQKHYGLDNKWGHIEQWMVGFFFFFFSCVCDRSCCCCCCLFCMRSDSHVDDRPVQPTREEDEDARCPWSEPCPSARLQALCPGSGLPGRALPSSSCLSGGQ